MVNSVRIRGGGIGCIGAQISPLVPARLASYSTGMGKGLKEPCSPYREAYVFGAELNEVYADDWNCVPQIVESTRSFNLSTITPNHEVCVALFAVRNLYNAASVNIEWYRDRDEQHLFTFAYCIPDPGSYGYDYWSWYYVYSFIGYVEWEIWENGAHRAFITCDGFSKLLQFTISGIPTGPAEQTVTLTPGESKVISFKVIPYVAKTYQVSVDGLTGQLIVT